MSGTRQPAAPYGAMPWLQRHWDARAAVNFMAGGAGSGLVVAAALAVPFGGTPPWLPALGALIVVIGLIAVWAEIGRPLRALNVLLHARRSWMTREALAAGALLGAVAAWVSTASVRDPVATGQAAGAAPWLTGFAALAALVFVYCQGRILQAAKGIPAWREPLITPLIVSTALAEGSGLALLLLSLGSGTTPNASLSPPLSVLFAAALVARLVLWLAWRKRLRTAARALVEIDRAGHLFKGSTWLAIALGLADLLAPSAPLLALALPLAGLLALAGGLWFKFTLVRRAAFNQGFALPRLPVRGVPHVSHVSRANPPPH